MNVTASKIGNDAQLSRTHAFDQRCPELRHPMKLTSALAETCLEKHAQNSEMLMTSVPHEDNLSIQHVQNMFAGSMPLRTKYIEHWPQTRSDLQCLHCGGQCISGPPIPAVRNYELQLDIYWVYGPFCRPCCALGFICESDATSKQIAPTIELLRRFFGMEQVVIAPPRSSHYRFGGPLSDADFYGSSGYTCLKTLQPPFVTFANYVVGMHQKMEQLHEAKETKQIPISALLPQSAGRLVGLSRPQFRVNPISEKKPSGKPPLILEFLATLKSTSEVKDVSESIDVKDKTKKRKLGTDAALPSEKNNFLKQYIKPNADSKRA